MEINIPDHSLVLLVGASGAGKSSFAKKHFKPTEILSSDDCRAWVSDDENKQSATNDAFDLLHYMAAKRLKNGLLTVIDATNVQKESRKSFIELAKTYHCLPIAFVLDIEGKICEERNESRTDRSLDPYIIRQQRQQVKRSIKSLKAEGFRQIHKLNSVMEVDKITSINREKLYNNKKDETGSFDIIGDVHGCFVELQELLLNLGYMIKQGCESKGSFGFEVSSPENRKAIFVGDLVDRGPDSPAVLRLVMSMVNSGVAYCVPGNHDIKLQKYLAGKKVQLTHGLAETVEQLESESPSFKKEVERFIYSLVSHYVFDEGKLVVSHAGLKEEMQGRASGAIRSFCLYGETTGEIDEFGLPIRANWAKEYRGKAAVVYGHTPVPKAEWLNKTIDIDTGCVFGGSLTALRYPENRLVSVKAKQVYCEPVRPINFTQEQSNLSSQQENDDLLNLEDFIGKRFIQTRLRKKITIREESTISALEIMSRFAVNPKWLIYLPPTMSPCASSELPNYLEHPEQALSYYKKRGIQKVVCEEKHMGSRVVLVLCKDESVALKRFSIEGEGIGVCYTRTGRNFFTDPVLEQEFLNRVMLGLTKSNFWMEFDTDWVCLDAELMPWSAKAQSLIKNQYAAVGAAASGALPEVESALKIAINNGLKEATPYLEKFTQKKDSISSYIKAYQNYCWPVHSLDDYKLAPFHILATEGQVHVDKTHEWHMQNIAKFCEADPALFSATVFKVVDFNNPSSVEKTITWWTELTRKGGEGMVVKPYDFICFDQGNQTDLLQPAIKCRGSEYLRIIYGPEYDLPQNIERLKNQNMAKKRSLALREFALGVESLERFIDKEPLRRIHECVFGILALESEEVDPRL